MDICIVLKKYPNPLIGNELWRTVDKVNIVRKGTR